MSADARLDPSLVAFGAELEGLGYVVVNHGDHLCVRLPQFASVRLRVRDGSLLCAAQFGPLRRERSTAVTLGGATVLVAGLLATAGVGALALGAAFGGVMLAARDVGRYVSTEGCITRLQMLWSLQPRVRASAHQALGDSPPGGFPRGGAAAGRIR
jgi:hypothetical protein